jgi:hypothetical protein
LHAFTVGINQTQRRPMARDVPTMRGTGVRTTFHPF